MDSEGSEAEERRELVPEVAQEAEGAAAAAPQPQAPRRASKNQACAARKFRRAYSISFSNTERRGAKKPSDFTRLAFSELLKKCHSEVFKVTAEEAELGEAEINRVAKILVFSEKHADGSIHLYAMVLADRPYACDPVRAQGFEIMFQAYEPHAAITLILHKD